MSIKISGNAGDIFIEKSVIANIAGNVATKCYGVVGMGLKIANRKVPITKGIKVSVAKNALIIAMHVIMEYGININTVSNSIVNNVKYTVEEITGIKVDKVQLKVESIRVQ